MTNYAYLLIAAPCLYTCFCKLAKRVNVGARLFVVNASAGGAGFEAMS